MASSKENLFLLTPLTFKDDKANSFEKTSDSEATEKYNPLVFCRTCASMDSCLVPIFTGEGLEYSLNTKIEKYLPIQVSENDDLSVHLCYHCASTLIAWDSLVIGCIEAEKKLTLLKNSSQEQEIAVGIVEDITGITNRNYESEEEPLPLQNSSEIIKTVESNRDIIQEKNELEELKIHTVRRPDLPEESTNNDSFVEGKGDQPRDSIKNPAQGQFYRKSVIVRAGAQEPEVEPFVKECPVCDKTFNDVPTFAEHLYTHLIFELMEGSDAWKEDVCKVCKTKCDRTEALTNHILLHMDVEALRESYKKRVVRRRRRKKGQPKKKLTCDICSKSFSRKYALKRHLATHLREKMYTCHHCGKQYCQESGLQRHVMVVHEGVRKYKCPICSEVFNTNEELKTHQDNHKDPRPFQCDQCGRTFISQKHLYHHRKYHHTANGMRILCTLCDRYFSSPSVLKRHHKVIHLKLKEYQCAICSAQLTTKHYLREHLRLHTDERPEVCTLCGKTFQVPGNLKQHLKTHMGKTQVCYVCGKAFTRRCHLLVHMNHHQGLEHPRCSLCERIFLLKEDLDKHLRKDHRIKL